MPTSVRDLQIGEMISVSASWIGAKKPTFLSIPEVSPLFGRVEAVHTALVAARDGNSAGAALRALANQAEDLDERHDHLMRALFYLLLAAQHHELGKDPVDEDRAARIEDAKDALFPEQLGAVQASYQAEAGNAAQLAQLASGEFAGLLETISIQKGVSALELAQVIAGVGAQLGSVEQQRSEAAVAAKKEAITAAEIRRRMRAWSDVAETILANLAQSGAPAATLDAVREPLLAAAEKATQRRREKRNTMPSAQAPQGEG